MSTFLVAHGAWSAGWAWKKMYPLMSEMGHQLITPTYTGLGERQHLAFARRAREDGWDYHELDASHNPHISAPEELITLLDKIASA